MSIRSQTMPTNQIQRPAMGETIESRFGFEEIRECEGLIDRLIVGLATAIRRHRTLDITTSFQFFAAEFVGQMVADDNMKGTGDILGTLASSRLSQDYTRVQTALPMMEYLLLKSPVAKLKRDRCHDLAYASYSSQKQVSYIPSSNAGSATPGLSLFTSNTLLCGEPSFVAAGAASLSKAFPTAFFLLMKHPTVISKLQNEIDIAVHRGALSDPPRWVETNRLQYLDAVLKESMRHTPAMSFGLEIVVPAGGVIVDDRYIPEGTMLECHIEALRRDKTVYGEDVELFRPERWLTTDTQHRRRMEQALLEFNVSRRISPGIYVSWLELKKAAAFIIMNFDINLLTDGQHEIDAKTYDDLPPMIMNFTQRAY
ncbi:hypothetical protein AWENTII_005227 [Aspergillus wentii]